MFKFIIKSYRPGENMATFSDLPPTNGSISTNYKIWCDNLYRKCIKYYLSDICELEYIKCVNLIFIFLTF